MNLKAKTLPRGVTALLLAWGAWTPQANAVIDGVTGTTFNLTAKAGYISTGDGLSHLNWGYANCPGGTNDCTMQYPGPTLIVNEGDTVTVRLRNALPNHGTDAPMNASIVFPGQNVTVSATRSPVTGPLTTEAPPDNGVTVVSYTFTATNPGTYQYYSGTNPELQIEMGMVGALIVRPQAGANLAYNHADTAFDHEYLFLITDFDPIIHRMVDQGQRSAIDLTKRFAVYWFLNGRNAPDTLQASFVPWLPTQPYQALARTHPGETVLMRTVAAGQDLHPFHHHGNNTWMIGRDGRMQTSDPVLGPDLATSNFTIQAVPGETYDNLFTWTAEGLGWDIYGTPAENRAHECNDLAPVDGYDDTTKEWCEDHYKPIPVTIPNPLALTYGPFYSGSPYLGSFGVLPPGSEGVNVNGGYFFMWHSHTEKELTNWDIFPGGMMSFVIIEPPGVAIP
jgi:FtsP/CotA-like multicopper oxidase with cupredoxin domain